MHNSSSPESTSGSWDGYLGEPSNSWSFTGTFSDRDQAPLWFEGPLVFASSLVSSCSSYILLVCFLVANNIRPGSNHYLCSWCWKLVGWKETKTKRFNMEGLVEIDADADQITEEDVHKSLQEADDAIQRGDLDHAERCTSKAEKLESRRKAQIEKLKTQNTQEHDLTNAATTIQKVWRGKLFREAHQRKFYSRVKTKAQQGKESLQRSRSRLSYFLGGFTLLVLNFFALSLFVLVYSLNANTPAEIARYTLYLKLFQIAIKGGCNALMSRAERQSTSTYIGFDRMNITNVTRWMCLCYVAIYREVLLTNIKDWEEFAYMYLMDAAFTLTASLVPMSSRFNGMSASATALSLPHWHCRHYGVSIHSAHSSPRSLS